MRAIGALLVGGPFDGEKLGDRPFEAHPAAGLVKVFDIPPPSWPPDIRGLARLATEVPYDTHIYKENEMGTCYEFRGQ